MTHIYIEKELMVLCEDVYQIMSRRKYWINAMVMLMVDITLEIELHKRFYNQIFIGLLFLRMQEDLFYPAMNVKELVISLDALRPKSTDVVVAAATG